MCQCLGPLDMKRRYVFLWLAVGLLAGVYFLPKLAAFPLAITNANWSGEITYRYSVVAGPYGVGENGVVNCRYFFNSYPYWEGDYSADRGSLQYAADHFCDEVPGRLTDGVPPWRAYAILHDVFRGGEVSSWESEAVARAHLRFGDILLELHAPWVLGRLI